MKGKQKTCLPHPRPIHASKIKDAELTMVGEKLCIKDPKLPVTAAEAVDREFVQRRAESCSGMYRSIIFGFFWEIYKMTYTAGFRDF